MRRHTLRFAGTAKHDARRSAQTSGLILQFTKEWTEGDGYACRTDDDNRQAVRRRFSRNAVRLRVVTGPWIIETDVEREPPLGWRFWTLAGFPGDPVDPKPYGGSRCLPIAMIELDRSDRWLCAMEIDESFQSFASHKLFTCPDQTGPAEFAYRMIARHAIEPPLF